jgi:hypothetical protein
MNYMCTSKCPCCVFTLCLCIGIHSICSKDSIVTLLHNRLLPINYVVLHYSDTGNIFQVYHKSTRFAPDSGVAWSFWRLIATIIVNSGYMEPISPNWVEEGETVTVDKGLWGSQRQVHQINAGQPDIQIQVREFVWYRSTMCPDTVQAGCQKVHKAARFKSTRYPGASQPNSQARVKQLAGHGQTGSQIHAYQLIFQSGSQKQVIQEDM